MRRALIGAGGLASEMQAMLSESLLCFVEDKCLRETSATVRPLSEFDPYVYEVCIAIADPMVKRRIVSELAPETRFFTFIHPSALCYIDESDIGEGTFVGVNSLIMNGAKIGRDVLLNRFNQVGHDSIVGDFFSGLPASTISGRVTIGRGVMLGSGATILQNLHVADNILIGAMVCVSKSLVYRGSYVGIPARLT
jgi:UDP-3-O-[3-hydroxymyristoyl] glucosamine N-acyltransferase